MRRHALLLAFSLSPTSFLAAAPGLQAQSFTPVREQKNLSPAALSKLHTLEELNTLPPGEWRFHAGDLPHGESPTLDDSSWPVVMAPTGRNNLKVPKGAIWYRREITLPRTVEGYDISGATINFQFHADANGSVPEIIYFNGRRVALGEDLEPIVLAEPAHPGDKILVAVKLLPTVDVKTFSGVTMGITFPTDSGRPDPNDLRIECIAAANLLPALPTPRPDLLPRVEAAVAAIDLGALRKADQPLFDASLRKAQTILDELHPALATAHVTLDGNAHIDAAWLWPRTETVDVVHRTFATALQLMNEYPDYKFTQSAAQYYAWMADKYPDLNAQIKERVREGRWEIVGGMWVEPDLNIPSGESLVRQLLIGQRYFQKEYGTVARIGWNPDSFGYNWQLPQIYKRSGLDYFVTQKMHWNDTNTLPFRLFWWQSPDGSKVLTYFPTDYTHPDVSPTRLSADFAESAARNPGTAELLDLYGVGDHGGGPTRAMLDQADHWMTDDGGTQTASEIQSNPPLTQVSGLSPRTLRSPSRDPLELSSRTLSEAKGEGSAVPASAAGTSPYQPIALPLAPTHFNLSSRTLSEAKGEGFAVPASAAGTSPSTNPAAADMTEHYGTAQGFFDTVGPHMNPDSPTWDYAKLAKGWTPPPSGGNGMVGVPTWNDELYFEYHRGIYTTQAKHKANIRHGEVATLDTEKLASLAWLGGAPYPAEAITDNWKKITFNQFHDLAAGSGIAVIYRDAEDDFHQVFDTDKLMTDKAEQALSARIDTSAAFSAPNSVPVLVTNTLAWPRTGVIEFKAQLPEAANTLLLLDPETKQGSPVQVISEDPATHTVTALARMGGVPALGYKLFRAEGVPANRHVHTSLEPVCNNASNFVMSNGKVKLALDKRTGCISSLISEETNAEFLAPNACGNQLQTYVDKPKNYDAWNIDPGTLDGPMTPISNVDSIKVVTDGPLRKTVRIERTWSKSHFIQDISLDADSDIVRVDNTVEWHETHVLLKAAFPLAASGPKATFEIPFGSIERPTTRNNSFEKAQFEVPALRWADLGGKVGNTEQGVSILNNSKYGYDALGNTLRLTLLRSPVWPDPDADRGTQTFSYAIYPHAGTWKTADTVHRGYEFNDPLTATQVFAHSGSLPPTHSFAAVDEKNVVLTAVKKAEDADALIFRMYESTGQGTDVHLHIPAGATYAVQSNLMEKVETTHLPLANDTVTVPIKPYEILTLSVTYPHTGQPSIAPETTASATR